MPLFAVEADLTVLDIDCVPVVNLRRLDLGPGLTTEGDQIVDLDDQLAEENVGAADVVLDTDALARLDAI